MNSHIAAPTSVRSLIQKHGLNPKRSLGQNFLVDESHLDKIIEAAQLQHQDTVLEIGPGLGTLTRRLATEVHQVIAVELDDRLIELLRTNFEHQSRVSVVHADILKTALITGSVDGEGCFDKPASLELPQHYKVVANLPYYITSAILRHLLEADNRPARVIVMVQKEVAQRICARPGQMSILAVSVQFYAKPSPVHHVPASAFFPRPKVDSTVLKLDVFPRPPLENVEPAAFFRIVKAGFGQKRKQLVNSLATGLQLSKAEVAEALSQVRIDPKRRAESLALAEWGQLYGAINHL